MAFEIHNYLPYATLRLFYYRNVYPQLSGIEIARNCSIKVLLLLN